MRIFLFPYGRSESLICGIQGFHKNVNLHDVDKLFVLCKTRATQFAPFSALTGYEDAIQDTQETALNAECKITNIYSNSYKMYE
jgi:hypothetical protein